jgi:hypothetical protein
MASEAINTEGQKPSGGQKKGIQEMKRQLILKPRPEKATAQAPPGEAICKPLNFALLT